MKNSNSPQEYTAIAAYLLLTATDLLRTLRAMAHRRIAFSVGTAWIVARFSILHFLSLRLVPGDPRFNIIALWIGAGSLLVAALFAGAAVIAESRRFYVPLLRISFVLFALTDAATVLRSATLSVTERQGDGDPATTQVVFFLTFGVLIVDLLVLAALLAYRVIDNNGETGENQTAGPGGSEENA
jgi:hypothetical protein